MPFNYVLKSFWWGSHVINHGKLYITVPNNIGIGFIFFLSLWCPLLSFEARLVEIHLFAHNDGLD